MGKRIFWIFMLLVAGSTGLAVGYIQSERFAEILKVQIKKQFPESSGLRLDFDRLTIGMLPPSISAVNVRLTVEKKDNIAGLGLDSRVSVERLGIAFKMIQAFGRGITINKVFVQGGDIALTIPPGQGEVDFDVLEFIFNPIQVQLDKSLRFHVRQIEFRDSRLSLRVEQKSKSPLEIRLERATQLSLAPERGGISVVANLEGVDISSGSLRESLGALKGNVEADPAGLRIASLDVQRKHEAAHVEGKLQGNIRSFESLKMDLRAIVRGSASDLAEFVGPVGDLSGDILGDISIGGTVKNPAVEGKLQAKDLKYGLWRFDQLQAQGRWQGERLKLSQLELNRSGGSLSLEEPLEVVFPLAAAELLLPLAAKSASYLEFAGEALKDVSVIKGVFSGKIGLVLSIGRGKTGSTVTSVRVRPDLTVSAFELNNQVWGKTRPYHSILAARNSFQLKGDVIVREGDVAIENALLSFPSGTLAVSGGLTKASGWDVRGESAHVDLGEELGAIAELPVVGGGGLKAHIHGKGDNVFFDFDLNQKNARFLNFHFGELSGRVTIDDRNSVVFLDRLAGKMNSSRYEVNGSVSIDGKNDDIDLTARFVKTAPDDLFTVFAHQLRKISWIPHGMTGEVDGIARITGGYSQGIDSLQIRADLRGSRLLYKGEYVPEISARAGLDRGTIYAREVRARKYNSEFSGQIHYYRNDEMKFDFSVPRGKVRDLDWISGLGFPLEGTWEIQGSGSGKWDTLKSDIRVLLKNLVVRTKPVPPVTVRMESGKDDVKIEAVSSTGDVSLKWDFSRHHGADSSFAAAAKNTEWNWALCALNRKTCADEKLRLRLDGEFRMRWPSGALRMAAGSGAIRVLEAQKETFSIGLDAPVEIAASGGEIRSKPAEFSGTDTKVTLSTATALDGSRMDWSLRGESSFRILEFVTSLIDEAKGRMSFQVNLGGSPSRVNGSGKIDLKDGVLRINGLDAPVEGLNGRLVFRGENVQFEDTQAKIGGGDAKLSGGLKLHLDRAPEMGTDIFLSNNRIRFFPVNFAEFEEARLSFTGEKPPYLLGGLARVRRVLMKRNFDFGGQKAQRAARYLPERLGKKSSVYELKIRAVADRGVVVDNDLLNSEFRGEISLLNNFEFPQITARAELVKGVLNFRNTPFTLDHAVVRIPNPEYLDPEFSVGGVANVNGYKVNIFAAGTAENPRISLSSSPGLSQEDILSLLAFGYTGTEARKINPDDKSALTYTEVGSILLDQLKLNKDLQERGFKISVAPSIRESEANIIRPRTTGGSAAPKVYLKTQVMRNLDASVGSAFGSSQGGNELDATLDYRVSGKASVGAIYEQEPGIQVNEPRRSYGADIKFRWGFK